MLMGETPCSQIFPSSNHHLYHPQPLRVGIAHDLPTHQTETIIRQTHLCFLVFYPCINAFDCIQYVSCFLPCGEMDIKLATGRPPRNRKFKMVEPNHLGSLNGISVTWAGNMSIFGMFITWYPGIGFWNCNQLYMKIHVPRCSLFLRNVLIIYRKISSFNCPWSGTYQFVFIRIFTWVLWTKILLWNQWDGSAMFPAGHCRLMVALVWQFADIISRYGWYNHIIIYWLCTYAPIHIPIEPHW